MTNGDAYIRASSNWFKKSPEKLTPQDYIAFGKQRCNEAQKAAEKLGLDAQAEVFLGYPDKGLLPLWEEKYNINPNDLKSRDYTLYASEATKRFSSPYKTTFNRAGKGYNRQNLLSDIKDILKKYKPKRIYTPHPLDAYSDHKATTWFVNLALVELQKEGEEWVNDLGVSYYLVHGRFADFMYSPRQMPPKLKQPDIFSQASPVAIDTSQFKGQKEAALNEYHTQLNTQEEKDFLKKFIQNEEFFWDVPDNAQEYLNQLEQEWIGIANSMRQYGFNVNFSPVVDLADDIEDKEIYLVKRQRIYSQGPQAVIALASKVIEGLNKGGVIAVLKHFPGLGAMRGDTHIRLPALEKAKEMFYKQDLLPFMELMCKGHNLWVMLDHAIYPSLSDTPASLSYEIQTNLLRKKLGFKGIIISDELLNMQSILEFAYREKIKEPYIGEIVVRAFQAGTDIALIYPSPEKAEEVISQILASVRQAVNEGRLKEEEINNSVKRILNEKGKIFGRFLTSIIKKMPLEEKICQKIAIDLSKDTRILNKYNLCGILPRSEVNINLLQSQTKIPMFIFAQHEGGLVGAPLLKLSTRSAYVVGREYERLSCKTKEIEPYTSLKKVADRKLAVKKAFDSPVRQIAAVARAHRDGRDKIGTPRGINHGQAVSSLLSSLDRMIEAFYKVLKNEDGSWPNPQQLSPLTINADQFEFKPFNQAPVVWLRSFPDEDSALYAYKIFKNAYQIWAGAKKPITRGTEEIILRLLSLKESIEKLGNKKDDKNSMRVLCLAAHPDDEDGAALAYLREKFNCRTYVLLATRGEAGENVVNSCLYDELGALRMEEMAKSASILGVEKVYYLGKKDFGYCVDSAEAFKNWGREDTLEKLVYFIRLIRPHIIITKHISSDSFDHCQHQALSVLAQEAFDLAGNPQSYPEMIKAGLLAWQPLKFYQRAFKRDLALGSKQIVLDADELLPVGNKTYSEIAFEAFKQHQSQWYFPRGKGAKRLSYQLVKTKFKFSIDDSFLDWVQLGKYFNPVIEDIKEAAPSGLPGVKIVNNLRIGLVEKNNNIMFVALTVLGCDFKRLDEKYLVKADLSQFDTIILGQGVYMYPKALDQMNNRLLEFVNNGGNLIVFPQYGVDQLAAPYPFKISLEPVTDENATVEILLPEHLLFNFPNKISKQDFTGWLQDRGVLAPLKYSGKYTELISCFSSRGVQVKGGYLISDYGKGNYIYTGYTWYRQLREFNLGAYKNLSNMLAYTYAKKNPKPGK